jgi:hypothetical protein
MNTNQIYSRVNHDAGGQDGSVAVMPMRNDTPRRMFQLATLTPDTMTPQPDVALRAPWSPSQGRLIRSGINGLSFAVSWADATATARVNQAPRQRHTDDRLWRDRVHQASQRRKLILADRRQKLRRWHDHLRTRVTLQRHQARLAHLRVKARIELRLRAAHLRRQMTLQQRIEQYSIQVEKAAALSISRRLRKSSELKQSHLDALAESVADLNITVAALKTSVTNAIPKQPDVSTKIPSVLAFASQTLTEVFGPDRLPTITYETLRELNLESIAGNIQLRHDMLFDPNLEFRPNDDGERGVAKQHRADGFWSDLNADLDGSRYGVPSFHRIPVLFQEIKKVMLEMVATETYRDDVDAHLDVALIAQELQHGVFDFAGTLHYIADTLKAHCAPVRDELVDQMRCAGLSGHFSQSLRLCFELLERMKLVRLFPD